MDPQDVLGLDKPIRLGRVSRVPKLTDDLLFDNIRGLPQIRNNHTKLSALLRRLDKSYADKIKKSGSKNQARQLKLACETEKLQKVLLFYQLWCHGLFPRATFKDCTQMLRSYTSFPLKEYRRSLLNNEIHRLKVEKGIITEEPPEMDADNDDELYLTPAPVNGSVNDDNVSSTAASAQDDEDDWGFLSIRHNNQLFVADNENDDDDDVVLEKQNPSRSSRKIIDSDDDKDHGSNDNEDEDDFNDMLDLNELAKSQLNSAELPNLEDFEDPSDHEQELEVMREMGI